MSATADMYENRDPEQRLGGAPNVERTLRRLAQLATLPWEPALRELLELDSSLLDIGRVSYWALQDDPPALRCELGYVARPGVFERGTVLAEVDHPRYFAELKSTVLVQVTDALHDPRTADMHDYFEGRHVSSLLDVPVQTSAGLVGVLCHEQVGRPRRFTDIDAALALHVAQSLSAMIEASARTGAEQDRHRAVFLDHASRAFSTSLDVDVVAARATELAIPTLADWAILDLERSGQISRIACTHVHEEGRAAIAKTAPMLTDQLMRAGHSVIAQQLSDEQLAEVGVGPEAIAVLDTLGRRSILAVPMFAGPHAIGAMIFGSAHRSYGNDDLALAEEYVRRVSAAIENARLHAEAQEAVRARDEFISMAAHELHGPLASLRLAAESLFVSPPGSDGERKQLYGTIVRQTQRLGALVDHMLDASRIGSGQLLLEPRRVDLAEIVRRVREELAHQLARSGSVLELRGERSLVGEWDGERVAQVVRNLLDNAIKFGEGKPITITLRRTPHTAVIEVVDRGAGIPKERVAGIFDPFVRAVSPRNFGGLGLGLFISKSIVEAHGGTIEVFAGPEDGARFTVCLPLQGGDGDGEDDGAPDGTAGHGSAKAGRS